MVSPQCYVSSRPVTASAGLTVKDDRQHIPAIDLHRPHRVKPLERTAYSGARCAQCERLLGDVGRTKPLDWYSSCSYHCCESRQSL
jgi:hypothetical protein